MMFKNGNTTMMTPDLHNQSAYRGDAAADLADTIRGAATWGPEVTGGQLRRLRIGQVRHG
jgi:hypothetical protein